MPSVARLLRQFSFLLLLFAAGGVHAIELDEAKSAGLVGETLEGYLAAVNESPSPEVAVLVEEVNAKRRAEYERIAKANGIDVAEVEALAAKKAIEKTRAGGWVRVNGTWRQK